jgi:hypothetical protein
MSLEYYTRTGHILPIGLAVCGYCLDKHLKSVDLSNSKLIPELIVPDSNSTNNSPTSDFPTFMPSNSLKREPTSPLYSPRSPKMRPPSQIVSSSSSSSNGDHGQVFLQPPVQRPIGKLIFVIGWSQRQLTLDCRYLTLLCDNLKKRLFLKKNLPDTILGICSNVRGGGKLRSNFPTERE